MTVDLDATSQRKRLGQFYSGDRLARLLASLAMRPATTRILDPMGGSGDMLSACISLATHVDFIGAVDVDPMATRACRRLLRGTQIPHDVVTGDAFDPRTWMRLHGAWDLVITNPPFVRYQTTAITGAEQSGAKPSEAVRVGLGECLRLAHDLAPIERAIFQGVASEYSGLADLAIPSLLLCAARVALGGRLAVVIPETCLSRDYAAPVIYLLRRFFEIEYVVKDRNVMWFPDASVRTILVVARRVPDKGSAFADGGHLRIVLTKGAANGNSLVGRAFPSSKDPDLAFARWSKRTRVERMGATQPVEASWSTERDLITLLRHATKRHKRILSEVPSHIEGSAHPPERLVAAIHGRTGALTSLEELGWEVGQGLRTGANEFFYLSRLSNARWYSPLLGSEALHVPANAIAPAVKRQCELPEDGARVVKHAASAVLTLDRWALPEDIRAAKGPVSWQPMTGDLAALVRAAAMIIYPRNGQTVRLPELSAVRTNVRACNVAVPDRAARFWYQLPPYSNRHRPLIYLPRVNDRAPRAYLNVGRRLVVDANFSTLWPTADSALDAKALLAILSSTWVQCFLELIATVLGGGALKVEAAHLRRLVLPPLTKLTRQRLAHLAEGLLRPHPGTSVRDEIDKIVLTALRPTAPVTAARSLRTLASELLDERAG